ncbi:hypothetical protein [Chitinophaga agrisoli]|uniref:hypothetical protein n=1 Tax=Chitinophaga agrisoli TaxID=2607653 RepID=UPI001662196B|nr:hypothetical protein [Chitinophaga agrisoli]
MDLLYKLIQDSGVDSVNDIPKSGQVYTYDDSLVVDQNVFQRTTLSGIIYATNLGNNGSVYYIIDQNPNSNTNPNNNPTDPYIPPPLNPVNNMYEQVIETTYTAGVDGENVISLTQIDGVTPLGAVRIVQIENETKPMPPAGYLYNSNTSTLSLLPGFEMYAGQTLFILYAKTISA